MSFDFQLLSLLLMFLLLVVYFSKKDSNMHDNRIFKGLLLVTYLIQLINILLYSLYQSGSNILGCAKISLFLVNLWFGLNAFYYVTSFLKEKYNKNGDGYKKVLNNLYYGFIGLGLVVGIFTLIGPVVIVDDSYMINYYNHFIIYFIWFYLIIQLLVLVIGYKYYDKKNYKHLLFMFILEVIMFFLQSRSPELSLFNVLMIINVYYCYFMLENNDIKELENVTLERDYARRKSIDKSEFLKVLSHEIRIPLNTIDGFSQVIVDSNNLDEIKNDVLDIRLASRDLIDVINGMIDLSIIESGNLNILAENYNVYDMFDDIKNVASSKLRDKKVSFDVEIDNDIPEILVGDSLRFSQVILNLLTNAIKYTDKGNISLKVDSVKSNTKCRLKVIVSDTGRGIRKEDLSTIFLGKREKEGAGLGLAVSKYLLELMGGSIEVESSYGNGSKFIVTLDQRIVNDCREEKVTRKRVLKPFVANDKRILLVDDNKLNLKVAMKLLQPYGVVVVEATSGKECLDILDKDKKFDLILMDDMMPEMSGSECLDTLKKIERVDGFYIPVVVLTANAVSGMREKYLNMGFEDYLAKPIDKYELDRILKKYLKGKK